MYEDSFGIKDNRTPVQFRNGPIQQRKCTDVICCILYLLLLATVIAFGVISSKAMQISKTQLQAEVAKSQYGAPFNALSKSFLQIALALICVALLCFLMVISTFIIPALVIYIYIPLFLVLMLLIGAAFLYVYFGQTLPLLDASQQQKFVQKNSLLALGIGIGFLVAFVVSIFMIISKKQKFKNIVPVLAIAKICFWQNCYIIFISFFLSILSVIILYMNVFLLKISQDQRDSQHYIDSRIMAIIIIVQIIWTHGIMEALSDFIFESIGIHWYFNNKKYGDGYSKCGYNCSPTLSLVFKHFGTIVAGAILAYIPESINSLLRRFQQGCSTIYTICCCCHKFTLRHLTKYGYCQTILQSQSFCQANNQMFQLKRRTKSTIPQLYMMGDLYMALAKILILMFSLVIVYILLIQKDEVFYFQNVINLVIPLLLTLMASSEICNHFINPTGLIGDTIVFMYTVDMQIEKKNFGSMEPYSCPQGVRDIIVHSGMNQQIYDD